MCVIGSPLPLCSRIALDTTSFDIFMETIEGVNWCEVLSRMVVMMAHCSFRFLIINSSTCFSKKIGVWLLCEIPWKGICQGYFVQIEHVDFGLRIKWRVDRRQVICVATLKRICTLKWWSLKLGKFSVSPILERLPLLLSSWGRMGLPWKSYGEWYLQ